MTVDETQQSVGGYAIVRKLGEGGMGVVYLATDPRLGRAVALKTLRRDLAASAADRERFLREARAAAAVEHDNIVPVYAIGEAADGTSFIAMPYLRGESLDARLRRDPAVPLDLVLKVADHVASGLAAAHEKGLVHRDIKPANIWLEGDPGAADPADQARRCKILDFGLARTAEPGDAQITGSGVVLGTPAYMAPEQARGERVDPRADLFSLGVVLYRMATGRPPFRGDTPLSFLVALATDTPAPARAANPDLPPDLAALIDRLLSKDPAERPPSADAVARAARDIRARLSPGAASTSFPQLLPPAAEPSDSATVPIAPARQPSRGKQWALGAIACLLALAPLVAWRAGAFDGAPPVGAVAQNDAPRAEEQPKQPDTPKPAPPEPKAALENPAPPVKKADAPADPDRAAALWAIGLGGAVCVDGEGEDITAAKDLPPGPFQLTSVTLTDNPRVTDAGLAALAGSRHLITLGLSGTATGDAGLAHLKGCRTLVYVYLSGTRVTGAGLAALDSRAEILELNVSGTRLTDEGLKPLARFTRVSHLSLTETKVTPGGVADLARALPGCQITWDGGVQKPDPDRLGAVWVLSAGGGVHVNGDGQEIRKADALPREPFKLTEISLTDPVKDADLAALAGCRHLTGAYLVGTGITSEGLAHLKGCKDLALLNLSGTAVCDEAVPVIRGFKQLADLSVIQSAVTEKGVKELAKALPGCRIQHNGGTTGPAEKSRP